MLRIHFTPQDLGRVRLAQSVDPLWELVFSTLRLCEREKGLVFGRWATAVRREVEPSVLRPGLRVLSVLSPLGPYFPDFLTPPEGALGLVPAVAAIRATPRTRLRREMHQLARTSPLPAWARPLADGDRHLLLGVGEALVAHHRAVIEPHTDVIQAAVAADRARRTRAVLDDGAVGLLTSLRPLMHWRPPVLEVQYTVSRDLHLAGRGLRLVPSYFCRRTPVALVDPGLPPTLVYPIDHEHVGHTHLSERALAALLGTTRSAVLAAVGEGATTTELAHRLGASPSSVSRHTTVLREAGILTTQRDGPAVLHNTTPLGQALLGRTLFAS
jgi:DNA-binding transcriptional ArsR family regulator